MVITVQPLQLLEQWFLEKDYPITTFFENKVSCKRTNNTHKFEGFFLRGQVSSEGDKVINGCIVLFVFYWSACKNTKNPLPESVTFVHPKKNILPNL